MGNLLYYICAGLFIVWILSLVLPGLAAYGVLHYLVIFVVLLFLYQIFVVNRRGIL